MVARNTISQVKNGTNCRFGKYKMKQVINNDFKNTVHLRYSFRN